MSTHREIRADLAAHLLHQTSPVEARELELHLTTCEECRSELEELRPLLPLYRQTRPAASSDFTPSVWEQRLLLRLAAQLRRRNRRRVVMRAGMALALAAVLVAALLVPPLFRPFPTSNLRAVGGSTRATGTVAFEARPWGTQLSLQLSGLTPGQPLLAYVEPLRGSKLAVGSWRPVSRGEEVVELAAMLPMGSIRQLVVETSTGRPLLVASRPAA